MLDARDGSLQPPAPPALIADAGVDAPPVTWPPTHPAAAWDVPDPGPIPDGTWLSAGYASSRARGTVLRIALVLAAAGELVFAGVFAVVALVVLDAVDIPQGLLGSVWGVLEHLTLVPAVLSFGSAIALVVWLSRVVDNIPPLTGRTPERSPREAIGWWFVPVACWWMPYTIVRDAAWRLRRTEGDPVTALVLPWWVLHALAGIASAIIDRLNPFGDNAAVALSVSALFLAVDVVGLGLLFAIVTQIERRTRSLAVSLGLTPSQVRQWPADGIGWTAEPDDGIEDAAAPEVAPADPAPGAADPFARRPGERLVDYEARVLAVAESEAGGPA